MGWFVNANDNKIMLRRADACRKVDSINQEVRYC